MEREHFVGIIARAIASTPDAVRSALARSARSEQPMAPARPGNTFKAPPPPGLSYREHRAGLLHAVACAYPDSALAKRVESEYIRINGAPFPDTMPDERWLFEAGLTYGETPDETAADDLLRAFQKIVLTDALALATTRLRLAEASGNAESIQTAIEECQKFSALLSSVG